MVGQDTAISLTQADLGPLPALPMLGALPAQPAWPVLHNLLPIIVVLVCALAGLIFARYDRRVSAWQMLGTLVTSIATVFIGFIILYWLGSGAAGPNRLSEVGVNPLSGAGQLALLSCIGFVLTTLLLRPEVRDWTKQWWRKAVHRVTRVNDLDFVPKPATNYSADPDTPNEGNATPPSVTENPVPVPFPDED